MAIKAKTAAVALAAAWRPVHVALGPTLLLLQDLHSGVKRSVPKPCPSGHPALALSACPWLPVWGPTAQAVAFGGLAISSPLGRAPPVPRARSPTSPTPAAPAASLLQGEGRFPPPPSSFKMCELLLFSNYRGLISLVILQKHVQFSH